MIKISTIGVGDKFQLATIAKNKYTDKCILNGHLSASKPEATVQATKGLEFEVTRKKKKIEIFNDGTKGTFANYFKIKPIGQDIEYEMLDKDLAHRCERIAPPYNAIEYALHEVAPRIFCAVFKNEFDMAMTFLRYQECYESSCPEFKGKSFTIVDYMRWYSKNLGNGAFTYTSDWSGFNVPSKVIAKAHEPGFIKDWNCYDEEMRKIYKVCHKFNESSFYLIGMMKNDEQTLRHEVAHGLFSINADYKYGMSDKVNRLPQEIKDAFTKILLDMGYHESVIIDEIQAYCSTGLLSSMQAVPGIEECKAIASMKHAFEEYSKEVIFELNEV